MPPNLRTAGLYFEGHANRVSPSLNAMAGHLVTTAHGQRIYGGEAGLSLTWGTLWILLLKGASEKGWDLLGGPGCSSLSSILEGGGPAATSSWRDASL